MDTDIRKFLKKALLDLDRADKVWLFVSGFFIGVLCIYLKYYENNKLHYFIICGIEKNAEIFYTIAGVIATICGIAIPIAVSTVSSNLKETGDEEVANYLWQEKIFRKQLLGSIVIIIVSLVLLYLNSKSLVLIGILLCFFIFLIINFYFFIKLIIRYTTDTDQVIFEKTKSTIDEILTTKDRTESDKFYSSLERIGKIIQFKIKKEQYKKAQEYLDYLIESYTAYSNLSITSPEYVEYLTRIEERFNNFFK